MKNIDYKQIVDTIKKNIAILKNPAAYKEFNEKTVQYILIGIIAVSLLDLLFVLGPQFNKITKTYLPKKREIIKQLNEANKGFVKTPEIQNKLSQIEADVQSSLSKLMEEKDIPEFLSWISVLARENKIKLMEIKPLKYSEAKGISSAYYLLPIQLKLEGGYHQSAKFINQLEQGQYFVKIVEFTITASHKSNVTHDVNIKLETFFLKNI